MVRSMHYRERRILVPLHTSVCLIDSSIIRKLCMVVCVGSGVPAKPLRFELWGAREVLSLLPIHALAR